MNRIFQIDITTIDEEAKTFFVESDNVANAWMVFWVELPIKPEEIEYLRIRRLAGEIVKRSDKSDPIRGPGGWKYEEGRG